MPVGREQSAGEDREEKGSFHGKQTHLKEKFTPHHLTVMKFGMHIGLTANNFTFFYFYQVALKDRLLKNHLHQGKEKACLQGFSLTMPWKMCLKEHYIAVKRMKLSL
jgi:hypothetical protein